MELRPVGIVRSPFKRVEDVPRERESIVGEIEVFGEYEPGLMGVDGVSHLIILWLFHKSKGYSLLVKPLVREGLRGVFATRHPNRPSPVGFTPQASLIHPQTSLYQHQSYSQLLSTQP